MAIVERGIDRESMAKTQYAPGVFATWVWRWRATVGLVLAMAAIDVSTAARAATIELKDVAEVSTTIVRLGQVARIHDADEKTVEHLASVTLFPAPLPGKSKVVDFDSIRTRLMSQGSTLTELEFSGSSEVTVHGVRSDDGLSPETNSATADLMQKRCETVVATAMRQYLKENAPSLGNVQIEMKLTPAQVSLLTAAVSARVDISGGREPWSGEQTFRAGFYDKQSRRKEFQIVCRIRPLPQVLVPTASIPKGHVVQPDDLSWKQQPVVTANATYLDRAEMVVGQEAKRTLRAGEPISNLDVRSVPLVRRGDIVTVLARSHAIVVRTDAKSLGDGSLGEPIKLVSLDGRRELVARVSGYHEATVGPTSGEVKPVQGNGTGVRLLTADSERAPSRRSEASGATGNHVNRPIRLNAGER